MSDFLDVYPKLPRVVRDPLKWAYSCIPLKVRLGKAFNKQFDFLQQSQWWSPIQLENYQNEQLRALINHAYNNVPYYHNLFQSNNLLPADILSIHDLVKLPILTKDDVRTHQQRLRAQNFDNRSVIKMYTSGTTGTPLTLYYDKSKEYLNFDPYIWRFFGWGGHTIKGRAAKLAAWTLPEGQIYSYNPVRNLLILSAYTLSDAAVEDYAQAFKKYDIQFIDTYPSSMELLVRFLRAKGIKRPVPMKAIFCHSEFIHDWQRSLIEDYWGCKCFDWYGLEERVILGIECEQHTGLHLCSDFGITEFIEDPKTGLSRIIATSITNFAMPMIRYDTGDAGHLLEKPCRCKRGFPLFRLNGGRTKSFAIGKNGAHIPVANIDIPNVTDHIVQFQFIQEQVGALTLNIVRKQEFGEVDLEKIHKKLNEKFGANFDVTINFVNTIQTTANGKTAIYIQKLKEENNRGVHNEITT